MSMPMDREASSFLRLVLFADREPRFHGETILLAKQEGVRTTRVSLAGEPTWVDIGAYCVWDIGDVGALLFS